MLGLTAVLVALTTALLAVIVKIYAGARAAEAIKTGVKTFAGALTLVLLFVATFGLV
jgi:hypothetical protein